MSAEAATKRKKPKWTKEQRERYIATRAARREGKLPPLTREVAELHAKGMSQRQIAAELKLSENAVFKRIEWAQTMKIETPDADVVHFPLHAVPARPARTLRQARLSAPAAQRTMQVRVKAGSEITVTIGGVEVQIIAEAK